MNKYFSQKRKEKSVNVAEKTVPNLTKYLNPSNNSWRGLHAVEKGKEKQRSRPSNQFVSKKHDLDSWKLSIMVERSARS